MLISCEYVSCTSENAIWDHSSYVQLKLAFVRLPLNWPGKDLKLKKPLKS